MPKVQKLDTEEIFEIPAQDLGDVIKTAESPRSRRRFRSTWTRSNANAVRPIFLRVLDENKPIAVPNHAFPNCSLETIYKKLSDGLGWLALHDFDPILRDRFDVLKQTLRIKPVYESHYILLIPSNVPLPPPRTTPIEEMIKTIEDKPEAPPDIMSELPLWNRFEKWVETAPLHAIYNDNGILPPDDVERIIAFCKRASWPHKVSTAFVRCVKTTNINSID